MKMIKAEYSSYAQGFPGWYYTGRYYDEDLDLYLLFSFLTLLTNTNYSHRTLQETEKRIDLAIEDFKNIFEKEHEIWSSDSDFRHNVAALRKNNMVAICSTFTSDEEEIDSRLELYPHLSKEEFKDYEYLMSYDDFFELLNDFLNYAYAKTPYIILYEDDNKKMYCKEYHPTKEEIKKWNNDYMA